MGSNVRRSREHSEATLASQEALLAYQRAWEHWESCPQCRDAALVSAAAWCDLGRRLMQQGVAIDPHWDSCARCLDAQALVRSRQCESGRALDDEYRLATQKLAALTQLRPDIAGG